MPSGRKSLKDEINILQRYAELSPKYFKFISEMLDNKSKEDSKWAVERLDKAFSKMLPQNIDLTTLGKAFSPTVINIVKPDDSDIQPESKTV